MFALDLVARASRSVPKLIYTGVWRYLCALRQEEGEPGSLDW